MMRLPMTPRAARRATEREVQRVGVLAEQPPISPSIIELFSSWLDDAEPMLGARKR
jgi:hypothetical protein